jgi:hypothetical protein
LPTVLNDNTELVLSAVDARIIVSNPNLVNFKNNLISSFQQLNAWFNISLSLNYNKTQCIYNLEPLITKQFDYISVIIIDILLTA